MGEIESLRQAGAPSDVVGANIDFIGVSNRLVPARLNELKLA